VGLNSIREICARAPLVMEADLLWDLVAYKKDKHKGVMMASRSLIALFRDINPGLLMRKERGRDAADFDASALEFGNFAPVRTDVFGADLLQSINTVEDDGGEGGAEEKQRRKAMQEDDDWNMATSSKGKDSDDEDDDEDPDDEDLGTNVDEINKFLRSVNHPTAMKKGDAAKASTSASSSSKKKKKGAKGSKGASAAAAAAGSDDEEDDEEDEDAEMEEMEMDEDDDGEEGSGDEEEEGEDDEEGEDEEEEEEEDEEEAPPAAKKRRTAGGAVASKSGRAPDADGEDEERKDTDESMADGGSGAAAKSSLPLGAQKIFTPKDFAEIHAARLAFHSNGRRGADKNNKRRREDGSTLLNKHDGAAESDDDAGDDGVVRRQRRDLVGEVVSEEAIVGWKSRKRMSKEERLASIMEGRDGGINAKKKGGGSTNQDKAREKPFQLVKHSDAVHRKKQRSFSQQQKTFTGHIASIKRAGKKVKNKMKKRKSSKTQGK
jgi:protein SDA1